MRTSAVSHPTSAALLTLQAQSLTCNASCAGESDGYAGEAVNPQNLSLWERLTGVGARYRAAPASSKTVGPESTPNGKA